MVTQKMFNVQPSMIYFILVLVGFVNFSVFLARPVLFILVKRFHNSNQPLSKQCFRMEIIDPQNIQPISFNSCVFLYCSPQMIVYPIGSMYGNIYLHLLDCLISNVVQYTIQKYYVYACIFWDTRFQNCGNRLQKRLAYRTSA